MELAAGAVVTQCTSRENSPMQSSQSSDREECNTMRPAER